MIFLAPTYPTSGLVHLQPHAQLKVIMLDGLGVTDEGLVHLYGLTQLEYLLLQTDVPTDAGVAKFKTALPDCVVGRGQKMPDGIERYFQDQ